MNVLTTGSRTWTGIWGQWRINLTMNRLHALSASLHTRLRVINGACPEGADVLVKRWAHIHNVTLEEFPADWLQYGKAAGPIRNQYMVNRGPDLCFAFLRDGSRGTQHTIDMAKAAGIPTFVIPWASTTEEDLDDLPLPQ